MHTHTYTDVLRSQPKPYTVAYLQKTSFMRVHVNVRHHDDACIHTGLNSTALMAMAWGTCRLSTRGTPTRCTNYKLEQGLTNQPTAASEAAAVGEREIDYGRHVPLHVAQM